MLVNFSWLVPDNVAGSGQPGGLYYIPEGPQDQLAEDLELLKNEGIGAIVSLTEGSLKADLVRVRGVLYKHIPIADMEPPELEDIVEFVEFADAALAQGCPLVVHCRAGMGRTGTMLACYLVSRGYDASRALELVRMTRPGSVETRAQEAAIYQYADTLKNVVNRQT